MKERPILFSAPIVRAILSSTKTQTRRVVKPQPAGEIRRGEPDFNHWIDTKYWERQNQKENRGIGTRGFACPYGQPGDRLWVRETWQGPLLEDFETDADPDWHMPSHIHKYQNPAHCVYAADGGPAPEYIDLDDNMRNGWRPSIHMPRWASRITLEITGVRVETLGVISHEDALAEGVSSIEEYKALWTNINGAWLPETWVWVLDFKGLP